jgi:hypothetical protein
MCSVVCQHRCRYRDIHRLLWWCSCMDIPTIVSYILNQHWHSMARNSADHFQSQSRTWSADSPVSAVIVIRSYITSVKQGRTDRCRLIVSGPYSSPAEVNIILMRSRLLIKPLIVFFVCPRGRREWRVREVDGEQVSEVD